MNTQEFREKCDTLALLCEDMCCAADIGGGLSFSLRVSDGSTVRLTSHHYMINEPATKRNRPDKKPVDFRVVAAGKLDELAFADRDGYTPLLDSTMTYGYQGGVRMTINNKVRIIAFSGLPQEHDRVVALLMHYGMDNHIHFHHAGELLRAKETYEKIIADWWEQGYAPVLDESGSYRRHWITLSGRNNQPALLRSVCDMSHLPDLAETRHTYLDVAVSHPDCLINFLVERLRVPPLFLKGTRPDPVAQIEIYSPKAQHYLQILVREWEDRYWLPGGLRLGEKILT